MPNAPTNVRFWGKANIVISGRHVCFWHKADIQLSPGNVRFLGAKRALPQKRTFVGALGMSGHPFSGPDVHL